MPETDSADLETTEMDSNADLAEYVNEIQYQVQSPRMDDEVELQSYRNCKSRHVHHGSEIALQPIYDKRVWIGCAPQHCAKATCPNLFMEGHDWIKCRGEVLQIFRAAGPGYVRFGDVVGFYAGGGQWYSSGGHKRGCPGYPNGHYGFSTPQKWHECWGEVFKIYAKGKHYGQTIQGHDYITVYHVRERRWLSLGGPHPGLSTCPGNAQPPPPDRYDQCGAEVFELWLR